ncbi:hypothetical protein ACIHDR_43280 [Nocardia sp. NPDC052278]|uniref:hypothetical protein n=1 Tax=unclassified Nocardia TaxID=2637762 RepID=UPI0036B72137
MTALPEKDVLLAACRGLPTDTTNPMLEAAAELTLLHRSREQTPHCMLRDFERHRHRLMQSVDLWVTLAVPVPFVDARLHTHSAGQVVDQLAQLTVHTYIELAHAPEPVFYDAQLRLDEMGDAYRDLIDELRVGRRRLPDTGHCLGAGLVWSAWVPGAEPERRT